MNEGQSIIECRNSAKGKARNSIKRWGIDWNDFGATSKSSIFTTDCYYCYVYHYCYYIIIAIAVAIFISINLSVVL